MELLKQGSRGPAVAFLQVALTRAGYDPGPIDGIFGGQTFLAVQRFQRANGLSPDGIVGPKTQDALEPWYTGYLRHTVVRGDTFYKLAKQYRTSVSAIAAANPNVLPNNLQIGQVLVIPLGFPVVPTNIPTTSQVLYACVRGILARYPFCSGGSIGTSVMGKTIPYLQVGSGATEVFYNGAHHANEWITSTLLLAFLERYCNAVLSGGRIGDQNAKALFARTKLYVVPMVNPDGVDLVTGALTHGPEYENAVAISDRYPSIPFPPGWKANIQGVDLNLTYPAGWDMAREIKFAQGFTTPAPRDYVGAAPLDAPESKAVYSFTLGHNFALSLSYHTQGEVIYWQYLDLATARAEAIGQRLAAVSGYTLADTPYESAFAGYKDWFIATYRLPGYTVEAGQGTNPLPISQFDDIYRKNLGILSLSLALA